MSHSLPSSMRAIEIPEHGGLEVIQLNTVSLPEPNPSHLLIRTEHAGVNFIDTYHRSGLYPSMSFPLRLGVEAAGTIVGLPTDEKVLNDPEYKDRGFAIGKPALAVGLSAKMQEYISVPWNYVSVIPKTISTLTGAAAGIQGLTALSFVTEAYHVNSGDWILVHAAAGGLGLLFCQLGRARGAHVIGTTSTKEKAALAKENGAEHVIIYSEEEVVPRVLELTNGLGVHAIFDGVGKDTWEGNFDSIRRKGTIISVGNASGSAPAFPPSKLATKNVKLARPTLFGYITTPAESGLYFRELFRLLESGDLKVKIHKRYPFSAEGVRQAQTDITGRVTTGKLVIDIE